jgi:hypothetical protein
LRQKWLDGVAWDRPGIAWHGMEVLGRYFMRDATNGSKDEYGGTKRNPRAWIPVLDIGAESACVINRRLEKLHCVELCGVSVGLSFWCIMFMSCTLVYIFTASVRVSWVSNLRCSPPPDPTPLPSPPSSNPKENETPLLLSSPNSLLRAQRTELISRRNRTEQRTDHAPRTTHLRALRTISLLLRLRNILLLLKTRPTTPLQLHLRFTLHTRNATVLSQLLLRALPPQQLWILKPLHFLQPRNMLYHRTKFPIALHQRTIWAIICSPTHNVFSVALAPFPGVVVRKQNLLIGHSQCLSRGCRVFAFVRSRESDRDRVGGCCGTSACYGVHC